MVELRINHFKRDIQVECLNADFVAAHLKITVRCDFLFRFRVQQHAGCISGTMNIMIFNIGKNLV